MQQNSSGFASGRCLELRQQISHYEREQQALLDQLYAYLSQHSQARGGGQISQGRGHGASGGSVGGQIVVLTQITQAREYVMRLKAAAEDVKQLERIIRPITSNTDAQDVELLVSVAFSAADSYASCMADIASLAHANAVSAATVPQQLQAMEQMLTNRLQAAVDLLRNVLSSQIRNCLADCGWPPPLVPSRAGAGEVVAVDQMFGPTTVDATNTVQRLMLALTRLQLTAQREAIDAAMQSGVGGNMSAVSDAPLLWMAEVLAAPLAAQLLELFGSSSPGSPGALNNPDLVLGTVHRLALENGRHIDFLQGVIQALELHGTYQIGVEFTRALREAVKQLLRSYKLPEVAAAGSRELWLAWIDALIAFEGSLGRSGLLGCYWDVSDAGELPLLLLKNSTLSVLAEEHSWIDAWIDAEAAAAASQVESVLYSEAGWGPGQQLLLQEGQPAWQVDLWPPRAAEEVVALVESLLARLRFIPQATAQERYLAAAVGAVLEQAHSRILRMLQQAELFKGIQGYTWLPRVCMCICFCHYVEQQLQDMHDDAQVLVMRLVEGQQQLPHANGIPPDDQQHLQQQQQQQQHHTSNGNTPSDWESSQQLPSCSAVADTASSNGGSQQQQLQLQGNKRLSEAAEAKLRLLSRPISDFSRCRREWVLKLGKAAAMGFMQHASGYVAHGVQFKAASDALPGLAGSGALWSNGVVSGELQPALSWLSRLLDDMSNQLDKDCFRQAWAAAAAAINRELFNNVACEAIFSNAGALQLVVDLHALLGLFGRYTPRPACHFREMVDAVKLLNLPQEQVEFVRQAVRPSQRAPNASEVLKSLGVYHLDPNLVDTVLSLRMFK